MKKRYSFLTARLLPPAARLWVGGHWLILVSLLLFASRLHSGSPEALLYLESFLSSAALASAILWGASLGLDLLLRSGELG